MGDCVGGVLSDNAKVGGRVCVRRCMSGVY